MLGANSVFAQSNSARVKYLNPETFTINDGLTQGLVNCIAQDHFGFMWFGTLDGLNRYDGYNVTEYRHNPDDTNSVSENYITSLLIDSKNRLWVGTNASGLNLFDFQEEKFIHFTCDKSQSNSLSDNRILSIQEGAFGALWVGTKNGLSKIVITDKEETDFLNNKRLKLTFPKPTQFKIQRMLFDNSGKELFSLPGNTLVKPIFDPSFFIGLDGLVFVRTIYGYFCIHPSINMNDTIVKIHHLWTNRPEENQFSEIISQIKSPLEENEFLYGIAKRFIAAIDPLSGKVSLIKHIKPSITGVLSSVPFTEEDVWFTFNFHLYQYNQGSQKVVEIKSYSTKEQQLISASSYLYRDRAGMVWVGTSGYGALKFNVASERFHRVKSKSIQWLSATASDDVFIEEANKFYLIRKNIATPKSIIWQKNDNSFKPIYSHLRGKIITAVSEDSDRTIILQAENIQKYDFRKNHWDTIFTKPITWSAIYVDDKNGLWFADDKTLYTFGIKFKKVISYPMPLKAALPGFYVENIFRDLHDILWLATSDGLFSFNETQQKWKQYSFRLNDTTSLSSKFIFSICADADSNYLWVGTNGGGFNYFNKKSGKCVRYTISNGLPNNVVYGILTDKKGNLWMSTNRGLSNFNPLTKQFENFTPADGLQDYEFNRHAYCKAKDGTLFFGGVYGYNYFNPEEINDKPPSPHVIITDIKSNGRSIDFKEKNSFLLLPAYLTKKIVFDFVHNTISFDFSSMNFKSSANNKYQYKLDGIDENWVSSSTNHSSVYSNLQPGSYIFKVKAGSLNERYTSIELVILPPWYMSWWSTTLLALFILALLYSFYRYNLKQQINLYKDHQRIASDLHDEIGSTLSSVHIYSEVAQSKMKSKPDEAERYLKQISNSVENTIESLDDIVWMLKSKDDRFEDIANHMRAAAVSICEATGYSLQFNFDEQLYHLKFGMETRRNLFLIYKEAINNVMKYANGKILFINLSLNDNVIELSIKDDGRGFNAIDKNNRNGLGNMQKRAEALKGNLQIISATDKGTNIILKFYSRNGRKVSS